MRAGVDHIIVNVNDYAAAKSSTRGYAADRLSEGDVYDQAQTDVTPAISATTARYGFGRPIRNSAPTSSIAIAWAYAR